MSGDSLTGLAGLDPDLKRIMGYATLGVGVFAVALVSVGKLQGELYEMRYGSSDAIETVTDAGYVDAVLVGSHIGFPQDAGCRGFDAVGFEIDAATFAGEAVELIACNGPFGDATIRER